MIAAGSVHIADLLLIGVKLARTQVNLITLLNCRLIWIFYLILSIFAKIILFYNAAYQNG